MAMGTDTKLYVAVGVLAVLGGALYLQNKSQKAEAAGYTEAGREATLPKLELEDDAIKAITKVEIHKPADGDGGAAETVVLEKKGEDWSLTKPIAYKANKNNVKSLVDSLKRLKVVEEINPSKDSWEKYGVTDEKATRATFYAGADVKVDLWVGDGGSRGQMARIGKADAVYAIKNYSSYNFARDLKGWRDLQILKFEDKEATHVEVVNENGTFVFEKSGEEWTGKHKKPKSPMAVGIDEFEPKKVADLVRAFKALNAADFGDGKKPEEVGLGEEPKGKITIKLKDKSLVLTFGDKDGANVYLKVDGNDQIFQVASWAADWGLADAKKFQKSDEPEPKGGPPGGGAPQGLPPGFPGGAIPGH